MVAFPTLNPVHKVVSYGASNTWGTPVDTGGSHTKGSWVEFISATSFKTEMLIMQVTKGGDGDQDMLVDIGIGAAASEVVVVPDLLVTFNTNFMGDIYYIPVSIPKGARIAARAQSATANKSPELCLSACAFGFGPAGFHKAVTIGANTADSGGTQVDPGGSANAKGSWAELSSSLTINAKALLVQIGNQNNATRGNDNYLLDIGVGAAASEVIVIPDLHFIGSLTADQLQPRAFLVPCNIPKGARVAARGQSTTTDATDRLFDVVITAFG